MISQQMYTESTEYWLNIKTNGEFLLCSVLHDAGGFKWIVHSFKGETGYSQLYLQTLWNCYKMQKLVLYNTFPTGNMDQIEVKKKKSTNNLLILENY